MSETNTRKQTSVYLASEDEQNIATIGRKTALKRQNDIILYALRQTAEGLLSEKREITPDKKSYFDEKAFRTFVELMITNGLDIELIKSIAVKNVEKLIDEALQNYQ